MRFRIPFVFALASFLASCAGKEPQELQNGMWRGTLKTQSGIEIPFNFEMADSAGSKYFHILNASERFKVDEIRQEGDSVFIQMPLFDSEFKGTTNGKSIRGKWIKHLADKSAEMPFYAEAGADWRFFKTRSQERFRIGGKWSVTFISQDKKDTTLAIGEFSQNQGKVTGTFLTTTGDYRFLEGTVSEDKLYLSTFDGTHAYLFTGKFVNDSTITEGKFYSGLSYVETWTARKDEKAMLPDAFSLTTLKPGYDKFNFSFPDLNGQKVSLEDQQFQNKVVVVQFFGSWCPNCMDETAYLAPFYKKWKDRGVEIVGLAYERTKDFERSKKNVQRLVNRFDVTYPMLITGYTNDKEEVSKSLPMLSQFLAFPTTLIIDRSGKIRKIHTGFSGPGTGKHYEDFVREFEQTINSLLNEG